jgi:V8-like Glu-specific endopeptidase
MHMTRRRALVLAVTVALVSAAQSAPAFAGDEVDEAGQAVRVASGLTPDARALGPDTASALRAYWTDARRAAAEPVELPKLDPEEVARMERPTVGAPGGSSPVQVRADRRAPERSAASTAAPWPYVGDSPATTVGKVYFYDVTEKKTKTCSAAVVNSESRNLVWTAGHCVHGGKNRTWHQNWMFEPHYRNGTSPAYGTWYAIWMGSSTKWMNDSNFNLDFGAVQVARNQYGQNIADVTGVQEIAWNYSPNQYVHNFGYPGYLPYNGQILRYCPGWQFDDSQPGIGMTCNMNGGSSGGPWLGWFNGWTGWINGNNSYQIVGDSSRIYSPYFGNEVSSLWNMMRWP